MDVERALHGWCGGGNIQGAGKHNILDEMIGGENCSFDWMAKPGTMDLGGVNASIRGPSLQISITPKWLNILRAPMVILLW